MEIALNGKIFIAPAPKARMVRKAIEMTEQTNFNAMKSTDLDGLVGYVADLFGGQFTIDDVYDGLDADRLLPTLMDCINTVVGTMGAKVERISKNGQAGM
ncbi:hypothetical protein REC12_20315 [Desulfosporosinus sp. PR]|uniref:phage tail assembly chaperone G n=1 Tax=Candidatus Desulfosporosinus nitrosoreducens TaxID=3401928 RepID=UPI0027EC5AA7|nr:hypothetical protein [Desulfosporosinus sp. PR]MDQ7095942.1 hypothetical protein [Desulfosporosinus sp. PR]